MPEEVDFLHTRESAQSLARRGLLRAVYVGFPKVDTLSEWPLAWPYDFAVTMSVSHDLFSDSCWRVDHCACSCDQKVGCFPGFVGVPDEHGPGRMRGLDVGGGVAEKGCGCWGDVEGAEGLGE